MVVPGMAVCHAWHTRARVSAWDASMSRVAYQGTRGRSRTYLCGMPVRHACHTRMPVCHPPETRGFRAFIPPKPRVFWGFIFGGLMCSCRLADSLRLPEFWEFLADDLSRKRVRMRGFQCSWRLTRTCLGATGMGPVPVLLNLIPQH